MPLETERRKQTRSALSLYKFDDFEGSFLEEETDEKKTKGCKKKTHTELSTSSYI
jgi:hypothetical protein